MARSSFLENASPVDFLYLDRNRLASLSGQLSEKGQITGLKSTIGKRMTKGGQIGASIKFGKVEGSRSSDAQESSEESYDPFWTHAYSFLQDLELNYAVPLKKAQLRSLAKFDAFAQLVDLKFMRELWQPAVQVWRQSQPSSQPQQHGRKKTRAERRDANSLSTAEELGVKFLREIPHLVHMTFLTVPEEDIPAYLWAAIRPEFLSIDSEDLLMKYGPTIDGRWTVMGIVDALPRMEPSISLDVNPVIDGVVQTMRSVRELIGRPNNHIGITPIAIYGPVIGISELEAAASK